jgi:uncharacterized protein (DUF302 family)
VFEASSQRNIERCYVDTGHPYEKAAAAFEASIGRLELRTAEALEARNTPWAEVEVEMARMAGPAGLMLFAKFEQGAVASLAGRRIRCGLYLVGNPAVATRIVRIDVRASLYVPFRVALYEPREQAAAVLSFDRPSSFLGLFEQPEMREIGLMLDAEIDAVMKKVQQAAG